MLQLPTFVRHVHSPAAQHPLTAQRPHGLLTALLICVTWPSFAQAQENGPADSSIADPQQDAGEGPEITVQGQRPPGSAIGDVKPELELGYPEIRSYGVSSIAELIAELAPQTNAAGGSPVVLLNGKRVPSFADIQDIPAEAISRVEILPEEVALAYGYPANQKVVNVVLRPRYWTVSGELRGRLNTDADGQGGEVSGGFFQVRDDTRFNLNAKYRGSNMIAGDRSGPPASGADASDTTGDVSTVLASLTGSVSHPIAPQVSGTLSTKFEHQKTEGYRDLPGSLPASPNPDANSDGIIDGALQRTVQETKYVGIALNGSTDDWQWSANGAYEAVAVERSNSLADAGTESFPDDMSRSESSSASGDFLISGAPFALPAGKAVASITLGAKLTDSDSEATFLGVPTATEFSRNSARAGVTLDLPLIAAGNGTFGELAINGNVAVERLSDGGSLSTIGYGLRWEPVPEIRVTLSRSEHETAPTIQQLSEPENRTPNVPVFDYLQGETVFASRISGGNPDLDQSRREATRLGVVIKPSSKRDLTILANFSDVRIDDPVLAFSVPTPRIETAFPDRFVRNEDGDLLSVDARPINIPRSRSSRLRWGVNLSLPLKNANQRRMEEWLASGARPEERPADLQGMVIRRGPEDGPPATGELEGRRPPEASGDPHGDQGPRMTFRRGPDDPPSAGPPGTGRIQFGLFHTWHLVETLELGPVLPELDLLDGDAIGSAGGQARHELDLQVGYFNDGLGARLSANWHSAVRVEDALGQGSSLRFGDRAIANLRLFANLAQIGGLGENHPLLRGTRVSFGIDNLFDSRQSVRDETTGTIIDYQSAYLDRSSRSISFGLRKIF